MSGGRHEQGFTLVELLVSLAITGLATGLLAAAVGTGRSVAGRYEAVATAGESVAAAQDIVRDRIERLLADTTDATGAPRSATQGDATSFSFVAPAPDSQVGAGMVRYRLALGSGDALDLAYTDADGTLARWRSQPLIGDVAAVRFAYFGPSVSGDGRAWQSEWRNRPDPPDLVRVRLRFLAPDRRWWPDLLVRPATTISTACELDRTTGTCRAS